jgi:hypothetical protein
MLFCLDGAPSVVQQPAVNGNRTTGGISGCKPIFVITD